ncbi:hypothetical protein EB796_024965 [Bugula neritina]|uniref:Uncharacterized protein n=1 Tax=Bugula neritina TaxID=10212 RepID=A0A7J7IS64_BUGNE|nr:hypothetical protein EB796_024965 [Bugula neritina]
MVQSCPPMVQLKELPAKELPAEELSVEELPVEELSVEEPSLTCATQKHFCSVGKGLSLLVQVNFITSTTSAIDSTDSCAELPAKELPVEKLSNCQLRNCQLRNYQLRYCQLRNC